MTEESRAILPHSRFRRHPSVLAVRAAFLLVGGAASAETIYQLDGSVNLGYTATTQPTVAFDPADPQPMGESRFFTDVRPGIGLLFGSPRLAWRAGYVFAASLALAGDGPTTYSNEANLSLATELTPRSTLGLGAVITQGGTAFQLSQQAPDAAHPEIRAPGNPDRVSAQLSESLSYEAGQHFRLGQGLSGNLTAPQDDLGRTNIEGTGYLSFDRVFPNDAVGGELRSTVARLWPLTIDGEPYLTITNSLLARWNHDFDWRWNARLSGGVQQVVTLAGSYPLAFLPTGSLSVQYLAGQAALASFSFSHGTATNLQTGTISMSDEVGARAAVSFSATTPRLFSASVGFLHNEPLGEASALIAAGTGNAFQGDAGFTWGLSDGILATARYSVAYQFGQDGGIEPSLAHVFMVGVTARYTNARRPPVMPTFGRRVDGSDGVGFGGGPPER